MESALRPRDIQARIRAGASPEEVAQAAGVPVERIGAFTDPVIAEREYIAGLARSNPVRRRGETTSHRTLRNAVTDALAARGVDADTADWDAWKREERRWQVRVGFEADGERHEALFAFDPQGRFSVAANDEGRMLIGDGVFDELALVRATQDAVDEEVEEPEEAAQADGPDGPADEDVDSDDAFHEGDLTEVDGVYDIVPPDRGDLDVLYDMLSSFDEDSVKIYAGLVHPKESSPGPGSPVVVEVVEQSITVTTVRADTETEGPDDAAPAAPEELTARDDRPAGADPEVEGAGATGQVRLGVVIEGGIDEEEMTGLVPRMEPVAKHNLELPDEVPASLPDAGEPAGAEVLTEEPEQLSLIDGPQEEAPTPKPRPRRKRASVPSWDEIMFGAPHAPKSGD